MQEKFLFIFCSENGIFCLLSVNTTTIYAYIEDTEGEGVKKEGKNAYVIYVWSLKCPLPRKTDFSGPRSSLKM